MAFAQHINKENPNIIARKEKKAEKDEETKEITYFPQSSKDEKVVVYDEGPIPDMGQIEATPEMLKRIEDMEEFFGEKF